MNSEKRELEQAIEWVRLQKRLREAEDIVAGLLDAVAKVDPCPICGGAADSAKKCPAVLAAKYHALYMEDK